MKLTDNKLIRLLVGIPMVFRLLDISVGYFLLSNGLPNRWSPECMQTSILTGEYGNPDGWETLTGPYVE